MDNPISTALDQARGFWGSTTRQQKIQIIAICVMCLAVLVALLYFAFRVEYAPLYSNLESATAGEIRSYLDERGIPSEVNPQPDGELFTVYVPRAQVSSLMVDVSAQGLLGDSQNVLSALTENSGMFTTETERNYQIQAGLEGQLRMALRSITNVADATVTIILDRTPQTITKNAARSRAGIVLKMRQGTELNQNQVEGIIDLVAASVPNLDRQDITLLDQSGNALSADESIISGSSKVTDLENQIGLSFRRSLMRDLEQIYGMGNVVVAVNVTLDRQDIEERSVVYTPPVEGESTGVPISYELERWHNGENGSGEVPGTTNNVPGAAAGTSVGEGVYSSYWRDIENLVLNETITTMKLGPGNIKSVVASVTINRRVHPDLNEDDMMTIRQIARGGLGTDDIAVNTASFVPVYDEEAAARQAQQELFRTLALAAIAAICLIALLIFAWRYMAARRSRLEAEEEEMARQLVMQQEVHLPDHQVSVQDKQRMQVMEELNRLALNKPEEFAKLVMAWMEEG